MAQHEQDREDLLREATALTTRAEISVPDLGEHVVVGFRSIGAASVFIGADPVYQFNTANQLRRGFRDGQLIKAVNGRLFQLRRERAAGEVRLMRSELGPASASAYLSQCRVHLDALLTHLTNDDYQLLGQAPADVDVVTQIRQWLESLPREITAAEKPNVA